MRTGTDGNAFGILQEAIRQFADQPWLLWAIDIHHGKAAGSRDVNVVSRAHGEGRTGQSTVGIKILPDRVAILVLQLRAVEEVILRVSIEQGGDIDNEQALL